jgi:hypothetical protein
VWVFATALARITGAIRSTMPTDSSGSTTF